jgi:hypothetical protein
MIMKNLKKYKIRLLIKTSIQQNKHLKKHLKNNILLNFISYHEIINLHAMRISRILKKYVIK